MFITLYHHIKTPIKNWCRLGSNPRFLIIKNSIYMIHYKVDVICNKMKDNWKSENDAFLILNISVNSIGKVYCFRIRDMRFDSHLHKKSIDVLV